MAYSSEVIADYVNNVYASGGTDADVAAAMDMYGVSAAQVAAAFGVDTGVVQDRYDAVYSQLGDFNQAVKDGNYDKAAQIATNAGISPEKVTSYINENLVNLGLAGQVSLQQVQDYFPGGALASGDPKSTIPSDVRAAFESQNLTQQQFETLARYFGNPVVLSEATRDPNQPTIKAFVGNNKSGYEFATFLATRAPQYGGTFGQENQQEQLSKLGGLVAPYIGQSAGQIQREVVDSEGTVRNYVLGPGGSPIELLDLGNNRYIASIGEIYGQETGKGALNYRIGIEYQLDPNSNQLTITSPSVNSYVVQSDGSKFLKNFVLPVASIALNAVFPGLGTTIGASLAPGVSAAAQAAIGNAVMAGLTTGAITGDLEKAFLASVLAGGGTYLNQTGTLGSVFDSLGLGDFKEALGIVGGQPTSDAAFIAADAAQLAQQGLGTAAIQQNLIAAGVDPVIAASAANLASTGASANQIFNDIRGFEGAGGLFTATPEDQRLFGGITTTTGAGALGGAAAGGAGAGAAGAGGQTGLTPGAGAAGGAAAGGAGAGAAGAVTRAATNTLLEQARNLIPQQLTNLLGAGIDYAALQGIGREATALGREAEARATAAGAAANVPFTPYTVTTGAGSTAFGTDAAGRPTATVSASPEYEALRQQALGQAGTALGAIDPAQSAQRLFERSEALAGPARQREQEQLLSTLGSKGLLGIGRNIPTVGGAGAVNPYLESLLSAQQTAQAQSALTAEQFGTSEALRQQQLAQALQAQAQGIDVGAERTLGFGQNLGQLYTGAEQTSAANQLRATLAGQAIRQQYENLGLQARSEGILGAAGAARGALGLPTQPGNTPSTNILNSIFSEIFK
jgi:hypothetical protein